jgi:rare lipoprotein A
MARSTRRRAAFGGAICLAATAAQASAVAAQPLAPATELGVSGKRLNVQVGSRVSVTGRVRGPGAVTASLQVNRGWHWMTLDRDRTSATGRYVLRARVHTTMSARVRVRLSTGVDRRIGRLNVYRTAYASWYGPGFYGNRLGCGGTLAFGQLGVAHKTLPCGTRVTLRLGRRVVRVPVIDRGPFVAGREFDLTAATAHALGFSGYGPIQVAS